MTAVPPDAPAEALLEALDPEQRAVATTLRGPVSVLAGAGTGKTRAITHRIAYGVATGVYPPSRVMALTFTTRAASELRTRLRALGAGGVAARTFHAAALAQLNHFWPQVLGGGAPRVLDSKARLVAQAAEVLKLTLDRPALRDAAGMIELRKVSALTLEQWAAQAHTVALPQGVDITKAVELQRMYERLKEEQRALDFEDVLLATAGMIETEQRVATEVREQYRFFVVDEFQDVSPVQQQLLDAWVGGSGEVCVVGDVAQTIYSFAGARPEFLLRFATRHPGATEIRLERNYRSVAGIVEAANRLVRGRPGALSLTSMRGPSAGREPACTVRRYDNDLDEARGVAGDIAAQLRTGTPPEEIAVLLRINALFAVYERALADAGVPIAAKGLRFFEQPVVRQAVMLLRAAVVGTSGEPLFKSVSDVLREVGYTHRAPDGPGEVRTRWEALDALATLSEEAPPGTTLADFVADLAERQAAQHDPPIRAVTLATLHAAKGLEWPTVYVAGCTEGLLPISYATTPEEIEEERRLLYVGVTRAQSRLRVSWAAASAGRPRNPSRFLSDLAAAAASGTSSARATRAAVG